jgi:7-cyano-7-deazaguanine synthase
MAKVVVLVSGGMDSAVLLYHLRREHEVMGLSINYGQRHARELAAATSICYIAGIPHQIINLQSIRSLLAGSSQTDPAVDVPEGNYDDPVMRITVVPNRNMILLAIAAAAVIGWETISGDVQGEKAVAYAAHAGDHAIYPDCRPEFTAAMREAFRLCHYDDGVKLWTPFVENTKADLVRLGNYLGVPFDQTWSCYAGGEKHCGRCGTCRERIEAFSLAGVPDPTEYEEGSARP